MSSYIFVNGAETNRSKVKDSKINLGPSCLDNVSKGVVEVVILLTIHMLGYVV